MNPINPAPPATPPDLSRYSRQMLFEPLGEAGQRRLSAARVTLVGCGALGTVLANTLVRAGVGFVRICDRDYVELDNLQRQVLFDEQDIAGNLPKAHAAAAKLAQINSQVRVEPVVVHVDHTNIEALTADVDLVLDGTDNFETRFLINDLAVKTGRPWVYGAVIGASGLCMTVLPGETPCLRCVFESAPPPEMNPTCDTAGVIGPAVNIVASFQAAEAMKLLAGRREEAIRGLLSIDVWTGRVMNLQVQSALDGGSCPCCKRGEFDYLSGRLAGSAQSLCGRNAVQIGRGGAPVDLGLMADRLRPLATGTLTLNRYLLRCELDGCELTLFADGRAIVKGTNDIDRARTLVARYIGN
jgi:adenylyltransferase/sulfurtransferase